MNKMKVIIMLLLLIFSTRIYAYSGSENLVSYSKSSVIHLYKDSSIVKLTSNESENKDNNNDDNKTEVKFTKLKQYWYIPLIPISLISIYYVIKICIYKKKESRI